MSRAFAPPDTLSQDDIRTVADVRRAVWINGLFGLGVGSVTGCVTHLVLQTLQRRYVVGSTDTPLLLLPMQHTAISHKQLDEASSDDGFTALSSFPTFRFDGRVDTLALARHRWIIMSKEGFKSVLFHTLISDIQLQHSSYIVQELQLGKRLIHSE
jgi:hypothetical protein